MKYIKVVIDMTLEFRDDTETLTPEDDDDFPYRFCESIDT